MTEYVEIPVKGRSEFTTYQNIERGPQGPGLYRIDVTMTRLNSDAVISRVRELLSQTSYGKAVAEVVADRVLGCDVQGPHDEHQIWVENEEYERFQDTPRANTHFPPARYVPELCTGFDG